MDFQDGDSIGGEDQRSGSIAIKMRLPAYYYGIYRNIRLATPLVAPLPTAHRS